MAAVGAGAGSCKRREIVGELVRVVGEHVEIRTLEDERTAVLRRVGADLGLIGILHVDGLLFHGDDERHVENHVAANIDVGGFELGKPGEGDGDGIGTGLGEPEFVDALVVGFGGATAAGSTQLDGSGRDVGVLGVGNGSIEYDCLGPGRTCGEEEDEGSQ